MTLLETAKRILQMASQSPYAEEHLQNDECRLAAALVSLEKALSGVLNSAADPSKAKFALMVNLAPVRAALGEVNK
jgi:hypothetical protein